MTIIVSTTFFDAKEKVTETRTAQCDFDAEFELPGANSDMATAISGRAAEIGAVVGSMMRSIEFSEANDEENGGKITQ